MPMEPVAWMQHLMEASPRILILAACPGSPLVKSTFKLGTIPCNPFDKSVIGRCSNWVEVIWSTDPERLAFF